MISSWKCEELKYDEGIIGLYCIPKEVKLFCPLTLHKNTKENKSNRLLVKKKSNKKKKFSSLAIDSLKDYNFIKKEFDNICI